VFCVSHALCAGSSKTS